MTGHARPEGRRSALIVATGQYDDPSLAGLRGAAADVGALKSVFGDPDIGGFDVQTVVDQPAHLVSEAVEEFFADRSPDDLLVLHFSGHGIKNQDGDLHFAASNTKLARLASTSVAAGFVNRQMTASRSRRIVLFLDCCYSGAFDRSLLARGGDAVEIGERFDGRGRAVITASGALEYAFDGDNLTSDRPAEPSVFTSAMVRGLTTGEADRNQDGWVGLDELYDYIYDAVREATPNQTPGKWTFGVQGDLHLARRGRPVTEPSPLPSELQQSVDSPLAGVRGGAVSELARLAVGSHAGLAMGARRALQRLAHDDSRTVMTTAEAALDAIDHHPRAGDGWRDSAPGEGEPAATEQVLPAVQVKSPGRRDRTWFLVGGGVALCAALIGLGVFLGSRVDAVPEPMGGQWNGRPVLDGQERFLRVTLPPDGEQVTFWSDRWDCLNGQGTNVRGTSTEIEMDFEPDTVGCPTGTVTIGTVDGGLSVNFEAADDEGDYSTTLAPGSEPSA